MVNTSIKSFDALKVSGSIAKKGSFVDRNGKKINITDEMIESMYSNFKKSIPLKVSHDDKVRGGYLYKFAKNPETNDIDYEGMVFDEDRISKIKEDGFDSMSPEVTVYQDDNGKFINAEITAGAMTRRPAMEGMESVIMNLEFSAPENDVSGVVDANVTNTAPAKDVPVQAPVVNNVDKTNTNDVLNSIEEFKKSTTEQITAYKQTIDDLTSKVTTLESKNAEIVNKQIAGAQKELVNLGIENPETIGEGLDNNSRLEIYNTIKKQLAKNPSMTPPNVDIKINSPNETVEEARRARASKLGYAKEYEKANKR